MKTLFVGLVVFALLILGALYITNSGELTLPDSATTTPENTSEEDTTPVTDSAIQSIELPPEGYRLHSEPDFGYAISLPLAVDVSDPQPGITRYRYLGPNNEPATEITDGFTITVEAKRSAGADLEEVAAQDIQGNRTEVIQEPASNQLGNTEALQYTTESEIGGTPITHYALLPGNNFAYIVSVQISQGNNTEYRTITARILESMQFFNEATARALESRTVPIAMLDYPTVGNQYLRESSGKERGCDKVVLIKHILPESTTMPLSASLEQLFAYESNTVAGWQNFIANQNDTLSFDRAEVIGGTAHIYLTGELSPLGGVCDNPRSAIQIEETALAYDTVQAVELYLNNEPTELTPSGRE